jgi:hypothetical protein
VPAGTFRFTARTHRHYTGADSATIASHPSSPDRSFGARRRVSFTYRHSLTILHCSRFLLRTSPCNLFVTRSSTSTVTVTAPSTEEMAGTGTRTVASRYSAAPELRSMIQVLQDRSTRVLELVNQEGGRDLEGVAIDAPTNTHPSTAREVTPRAEDAPPCSSLLHSENIYPPPSSGRTITWRT